MATLDRIETLKKAAGSMADNELRNHIGSDVIRSQFPKYKETSHLSESETYTGVRDAYLNWLLKTFPDDDSWDIVTERGFDKFDPEKFRELYISGRPARSVKQQVAFNAFLPLIEPQKYIDEQGNEKTDPDWYGANREQMEQLAKGLGYNLKNKRARVAFYDKLREYATDYDRGNIVQNTLEGNETNSVLPSFIADKLPNAPRVVQRLGMAMNPTATEEAIRQSLTGDYDDARMNTAVIGDLATQLSMATAPGISYIAKSPVRMGLADAGIEGARQLANYLGGFQTEPQAPIGAGLAAATVPMGARYLGSMLKGVKLTDRPFLRGLNKGLRGADDPRAAERDLLKQLLVKARDQSKAVQSNTFADGNPGGNLFGVKELESATDWNNAAEMLRTFGFRRRELSDAAKKAVQDASDEMDGIKLEMRAVQTNYKIPKAERNAEARSLQAELDKATKKFEQAEATYKKLVYDDIPSIEKPSSYYSDDNLMGDLYAEDVIGRDPSFVRGGPVQVTSTPRYSIDKIIEDFYDRPTMYTSLDYSGTPSIRSYTQNKVGLELLKKNFPEKYAEEAMRSNKKYTAGVATGHALGGVMNRIEPALRANPFKPSDYDEKVDDFKKSEWYNNLSEEKRKALERALKGN